MTALCTPNGWKTKQ